MTSLIARTALASSLLLAACSNLESDVVTLDGRDVEVVAAGEGPTTVVFEAGLGDDWAHWDRVASALSEDARVFAYSRPGYGRSDDTTAPRDAGTIVEELHDLLASQGIAPPYVLVGHSFGGTYMELFARSHPDETAGLVLVDSRPSDFLAECEAAGLDGCGVPAAAVEQKGGVFQAEYDAFPDATDEILAAGAFGAYPVRVLTASRHPGASPEYMALWTSMHAALADDAEDGEQIVLDGTHYLQVFQARAVADAVRGVLP